MKLIIDSYGKFILETVVLISLLMLLFTGIRDDAGNQGVLKIIGANLQTDGIDYKAYRDFDKYAEEAQKKSPGITYHVPIQMRAAVNIIADYISAVSDTGEVLKLKVLSVKDINGLEMEGAYDSGAQTLTFPSPGIYTLRLQTVDQINKKTIVDIDVPVIP